MAGSNSEASSNAAAVLWAFTIHGVEMKLIGQDVKMRRMVSTRVSTIDDSDYSKTSLGQLALSEIAVKRVENADTLGEKFNWCPVAPNTIRWEPFSEYSKSFRSNELRR